MKQMLCCKNSQHFNLRYRETYSSMAICFNWKVLLGTALLRIHGTTEYTEKKKMSQMTITKSSHILLKCLPSLGHHILLVK